MYASAGALIIGCSCMGLIWAVAQYSLVAQTKLEDVREIEETKSLKASRSTQTELALLKQTYEAISSGAEAFLRAEYGVCISFVLVFAAIIFAFVTWSQNFRVGFFTTVSFLLGALTSILSGYIGMRVAVFANVRTTINAQKEGFVHCFNTAFRAGSVMGFALTGLGILMLYLTLLQLSVFFKRDEWKLLMDCISGFGLGGSTIALFGRVGGGIYTKAADVGADLVGKVVHGIPEDDPRNPATIADNVGDNVGDVAGMGADLFGSFAESTCATLVIAAQTPDLSSAGWQTICFPLVISSCGVLICIATSLLATTIFPVRTEERIDGTLRSQLVVTTMLLIPVAYWASSTFLPAQFEIPGMAKTIQASHGDAFTCVICGAICGLIIGLSTEYFTSKEYLPVKGLVNSCRTGAATNVISGLALGYKSAIIPVFILSFIIYVTFELCDLYGISLAAVGMLSNLATSLTIDAYGPICDNAGGIAEMAGLHRDVRRKTDALDAAGNTTAAIGKGFAIGSACLVSLALFGAFVTRVRFATQEMHFEESTVQLLQPLTLSFLFIGSMLPYWFSALTMKSVGDAAMEMVHEVQYQFDANPDLLNPNSSARPDYERCVAISTKSALREMIAPGALVILAPLLAGTLFGIYAVYGLLVGAILSGVQLAISMSNTGGAWDNAKKFIESNVDPTLGGKGSDAHKAAVVGDTVGDPLKDTSGPSLNILMKLMAILSLVFADFFYAINNGRGLLNIPTY